MNHHSSGTCCEEVLEECIRRGIAPQQKMSEILALKQTSQPPVASGEVKVLGLSTARDMEMYAECFPDATHKEPISGDRKLVCYHQTHEGLKECPNCGISGEWREKIRKTSFINSTTGTQNNQLLETVIEDLLESSLLNERERVQKLCLELVKDIDPNTSEGDAGYITALSDLATAITKPNN